MLSALHRNYFPGRFPTLWKLFDQIVVEGKITSTREAYREIADLGGPTLGWADKNKTLFATPDAKEASFVVGIYAIPHFQGNIEKQKILRGGKNADPFLVARAAVLGGTVVTMEKFRDHAAKIPNICKHFSVECIDLEGFMAAQGWTF